MNLKPRDPATLLRDTLAQLGIRQVDLARRTGLSAKHINQIAQGEVGISATIAMRFERATGVAALTWMHAQAAAEERLLRQRPRVWWSDSLGLIEQLIPAGSPVRYLRVTTNTLLDDLPGDAVELAPVKPAKRRKRVATPDGQPAPPPSHLVDGVAEKLRPRKLRFGPNTCGMISNGAAEVYMNGGEREYMAYVALEAIAEARAEAGLDPLW